MQRISLLEMKMVKRFSLKLGLVIRRSWISLMVMLESTGWNNSRISIKRLATSTPGTMLMIHVYSMDLSRQCLCSFNMYRRMANTSYIVMYTTLTALSSTWQATRDGHKSIGKKTFVPSFFPAPTSSAVKSMGQCGQVTHRRFLTSPGVH